MFKSPILIGLVCAGVVLTGCQVDTTPKTVSTFTTRGAPSVVHAPWRGVYRLYAAAPNAKGFLEQAGKAIAEVHLFKDQLVGFMRTAQGAIVAVAGDQQFEIGQGQYEWVMQADGGQTDPALTAIVIVAVVVVALGVTAIIIAVDINRKVKHLL